MTSAAKLPAAAKLTAAAKLPAAANTLAKAMSPAASRQQLNSYGKVVRLVMVGKLA